MKYNETQFWESLENIHASETEIRDAVRPNLKLFTQKWKHAIFAFMYILLCN